MSIDAWDWTGDDERPLWERVLVGLRDGGFLGVETGVRRRGLASVNAGWLARGGLLRLFHDRLEFEPNPLERLLRARPRVIAFADVARFERRPARRDEVSPVGEAPRIRIHLLDGDHLDLLPAGDLDDWLVEVRESHGWWLRKRRGGARSA
ncbi:MAG: hypothetical protein K2X91_11185 [Thermoleophilia bacterium]|nr:hypothetical protein [Thermoleophilia bacterium]